MIRHGLLCLAGAAASLMALSGTANALTALQPVAGEPAMIQIADRHCDRDDRGWHTMRGDHRMSCRPSRPSRDWIWHIEGGRSGWWHRREHRWND